ncbi:MAG TPA: hypothetical protein VF006_12725 [Longimicrobium sp.]
MSAAPLDDRINARAQVEHVARGLYADPTAALRAMGHDAHTQGADEVRRRLEDDFTHYGEPATRLHGPARERAQLALRDGGVAADVERWLTLDHTPAGSQLVRGGEIESVMQAPDAEALGRTPADARWSLPGEDPRAGLNPEERLAYDQIEAFAEAKERADRRQAAEARLHEIADHRDNLAAAEANIPRAKAALKSEVEGVFADGAKAMERIETALERDGPAETARRIRSGDLLKNEQKKITAPKRAFGVIPRRDRAAEAEARERVAQRIETIGYYEGNLGKWSSFQPQDGPAVHGAKNVRAALDREEARVAADSGIGRDREQVVRNRPAPVHPSREASQLGRAAQEHLDRLPPESRERVIRAARQSGVDRIGAALGHLQTIQMAARTLREGIEPPGQ